MLKIDHKFIQILTEFWYINVIKFKRGVWYIRKIIFVKMFIKIITI